MQPYQYIPLDPGEIDHVLYLLRQDFDPEVIRIDPDCKRYRRGVAGRLQIDIDSLVADQPMASWRRPRDKSDWAHLSGDSNTSDFVRACARMWCSLWWLESSAISQAQRSPEPGDPPVTEWRQDWDRLRAAMLEVALSLSHFELITAGKRVARTAEYKATWEKFRGGRKPGSIADHNRWLEEFILDHPGKTARELREMIRARSGDPECPFEVDDDHEIMREDGSPADVLERIKTRRKRMRAAARGH